MSKKNKIQDAANSCAMMCLSFVCLIVLCTFYLAIHKKLDDALLLFSGAGGFGLAFIVSARNFTVGVISLLTQPEGCTRASNPEQEQIPSSDNQAN